MPVYMIQGEHRFGPIKIGHSIDPDARLGALQVSHWEELRIIRLFEGGEVEEALLHAMFADLYMRGEWHSCSRAMFGDVGLVEITLMAPPPSVIVLPTSHTELVARVEEFLFLRGMSPTLFGRRAVNDGKLVARLRAGKNIQTATINRTLEFMASHRLQPEVSV